MRVTSALPVLIAGASAQQTLRGYDQCGGQGYQGAGQCPNGWECTTYNPWYAQCVPAATSAPIPTSSRSTTSVPVPAITTTSTRTTSSSNSNPTTTFVTVSTTTTSGPAVTAAPTPTTLQSGWFWIRAVATPNYRSYLQPAPTALPSPGAPQNAIIASSKGAGQFNVVSGQLVQNKFGNGPNQYLHVENNPADRTQRKLRTWFESTPNTHGAFGFQGDTLVWSVADIKRPNEAAWLVCGEGKELFVNTGAFLYDTPAGCYDHTIHSYGGAQADV